MLIKVLGRLVTIIKVLPTGIAVRRGVMGAGLTRATLELGGKNSGGFLRDVDKAVNGIIEAGFLHSGQVCAAAERFIVHRLHR